MRKIVIIVIAVIVVLVILAAIYDYILTPLLPTEWRPYLYWAAVVIPFTIFLLAALAQIFDILKNYFSSNDKAEGIPLFPMFEGEFETDEGKKRFIEFLLAHERQIVEVKGIMTDEDADAHSTLHKGDYGSIFSINLTYRENDYLAGAELILDLTEGKGDLFMVSRFGSTRFIAFLKIIGISGPYQGIFSISAKPISIEQAKHLENKV